MEKGTILLNDYSNCLIKIADRKQNVIDTASNISKISRVVFRDEFAKQVSKASSVSTEYKEELSGIRKNIQILSIIFIIMIQILKKYCTCFTYLF